MAKKMVAPKPKTKKAPAKSKGTRKAKKTYTGSYNGGAY